MGLLFLQDKTLELGEDHHHHMSGHWFLPENDMYIPPSIFAQANGVTEERFDAIIDRAVQVYKPIFASRGWS